MVNVFDNMSDYTAFVSGGLVAGELYWVKENDSVHFRTNNIDGIDKVYDMVVMPEGNLEITENGEEIDVAEYATVTVNVSASAANENEPSEVDGEGGSDNENVGD